MGAFLVLRAQPPSSGFRDTHLSRNSEDLALANMGTTSHRLSSSVNRTKTDSGYTPSLLSFSPRHGLPPLGNLLEPKAALDALLRAPHFAENTARSIRLTPCSPTYFEWRPECISVRRRNIDWMRPQEAQTPLKIERQLDGKITIIWVIGRLRLEDLEELKAQTNDTSERMILDLHEVTLLHADVIRFLSTSEEEGITLVRCPPYVREWIQRERAEGKTQSDEE